jgi:UDP-glucose 4-epimerase
LWGGGESSAINLGSGRGFSVLEVIAEAERVCGRKIDYRAAPRRAGDPPILVASSQKARKMLGWTPEASDLDAIIGSAWRWEQHQAGTVQT